MFRTLNVTYIASDRKYMYSHGKYVRCLMYTYGLLILPHSNNRMTLISLDIPHPSSSLLSQQSLWPSHLWASCQQPPRSHMSVYPNDAQTSSVKSVVHTAGIHTVKNVFSKIQKQQNEDFNDNKVQRLLWGECDLSYMKLKVWVNFIGVSIFTCRPL